MRIFTDSDCSPAYTIKYSLFVIHNKGFTEPQYKWYTSVITFLKLKSYFIC